MVAQPEESGAREEDDRLVLWKDTAQGPEVAGERYHFRPDLSVLQARAGGHCLPVDPQLSSFDGQPGSG